MSAFCMRKKQKNPFCLSGALALFLFLLCVGNAFHWHKKGEVRHGDSCAVCAAVSQSRSAVVTQPLQLGPPCFSKTLFHQNKESVAVASLISTPPSRAPPSV
ncbi:MAG: hypothetical protein HYU99_09400 [Deltaproteobacteria bacterium]|nr:hypothetical protein [Deltaproteobacteria bacterium]